MSDLNAVVNQDTLNPLTRLAIQAGQGLYNWGGFMGLPSLHDLITGNVNQPTGTISAANAPQTIPDTPIPVRPSPPAIFKRGDPGTQSGFAINDPNALGPVRPGTPLAANTAGIPGFPGAQSGTALQGPQPDRSYNPTLAPPAPRPVDKIPSVVAKTDPDDPVTPGRPGAPTPASISREQQIVDDMQKVVDRLLNPPPGPKLNLEQLPSPPPIQQQQSWMSTILSSAGLVLATLGARRSAEPMTAAIKSFGGYLQGYNEGNKEVAQQQYQHFQDQLKIAIERNKEEMEGYKATLEANKDNAAELKDALYGMSLINENEHAQAMLDEGKLKDFEHYQLGMQQNTIALQKMWLKIQEYNQNAALLGLPTIDAGPYPTMSGGDAIKNAIRGQEGSGPESVSPKGARGGMQILQATFDQYKQPGESFDNEQDRTAVADRYLTHLEQLYPDDPARIAVGYFSGEGNVAPPGSQTPWKVDKSDGTTSTSTYVTGVLSRMGGQQQMDGTPQPVAGTDTPPAPTSAGLDMSKLPPGTRDIVESNAQQMAEGNTVNLTGLPKPLQQLIQTRKAQIEQQAGDILRQHRGADLTNYLKDNNPQLASMVQAILDGRMQVPGWGALRTPYWQNVIGMVQSVDPNWNEQRFTIRQQYTPGGAVGKALVRVSRMTAAADQVLSEVSKSGLTSFPKYNVLEKMYLTGTGSPEFTTLYLSLRALAEEVTAVARPGSGAEKDIQDVLAALPTNSSPAQLRAGVKALVGIADGQIQAYQDDWTDGGLPGNMPGISTRVRDRYTSILQMDPESGESLPSGAPPGAQKLPDGRIVVESNGQWYEWKP